MRSGGHMRERVHCQSKGPAADEFGNPVPTGSAWATQFTVWAGLRPRNGGEAVIAGRLQGVQPYVVTMRSSAQTRQISSGWRLIDANDASRVFNVRTAADPDGKRQWLELLVEEGG